MEADFFHGGRDSQDQAEYSVSKSNLSEFRTKPLPLQEDEVGWWMIGREIKAGPLDSIPGRKGSAWNYIPGHKCNEPARVFLPLLELEEV